MRSLSVWAHEYACNSWLCPGRPIAALASRAHLGNSCAERAQGDRDLSGSGGQIKLMALQGVRKTLVVVLDAHISQDGRQVARDCLDIHRPDLRGNSTEGIKRHRC